MKAKNNLKKRIMSFLLVLCMVAAIVPVIPAAEAATNWGDGSGKYHIYDFRKGNNWSGGVQSPLLQEITYEHTDSDAESNLELNHEIYSDPWVAANIVTSGSGITNYYAETQMNMGIYVDSPADALPVMKIKVEKSGTYVPRVIVSSTWRIDGTNLHGGAIKAKIGKFSDANAAFGKYSISSVLSETTTTINAMSIEGPIRIELPAVYLEKGEYALQITGIWRKSYEQWYQNNGNMNGLANTSGRFYLRSLELLTSNEYNEKRATTTEKKELVYDFTILDGVADTQAKVNAIKYDDTVNAGSAPWTIYSYLPDAHTNANTLWSKDQSGFMYGQNLLPAAKRGKALNLLGTGKHIGGAVMLHVPASGNYVVKFNGGNGHNQTVTYYLMKLNVDRSVDTCKTYRDTDEGKKLEIVTSGVKDYYFNNGEAISLDAGEYILSVNCIAFYDTLFNSLTLTPEKEPEPDIERYHVYDFRKVNQGTATHANTSYLSGENITYAMTATGGASEINPSVYSDPWQTINLSPNSSRFAYVLDGYQNMGIRIYYPNDIYRTLKIKVQGSGTYMPVLTIAGNVDGDLAWLNTKVQFSKLNADGSTTPIAERTGIDASAINGPIKVELADAPIEMKRGEEYVIGIGGNTSSCSTPKGFSVWIQKAELIADYEAKLPVNRAGAQPTKLHYDFTALNDEDHFDSQTAVDAITYADTVAAGSAPWKLYSSLPGRYSRLIYEFWDAETKAFYYRNEGYGLATAEFGDDATNAPWRAGAVMIQVPVDGKYVVKVHGGCINMNNTDFFFIPLTSYRTLDCDGVAHDGLNFENVKYKYNTSSGDAYFAFNGGEAIDLEAGEYILWMGHSNGAYANSLTLTPEGWEEETPASEIFGDTYAYVKDGSVYFIGGLKEIDGYTSVGFEVWVNGSRVDDIHTDKVYTSFTVGEKTVNASEWASQYVFITEKSGLNSGDKVVVKPYIAKGDAEDTVKTYHDKDLYLELTI